MKAPWITRRVIACLAVVAVAGCAASGKAENVVEGVVEAGLDAKLAVLSRAENLERIERITEALLRTEAVRAAARELAESAVLGVTDAARQEALAGAFAGLVDGLSAALAEAGEEGLKPELDALLRDASGAVARGVLAEDVRAQLEGLSADLSRVVAESLLDQVAAELPGLLDASASRLSPRVASSLRDDLGPALAASLTRDLMPALSAGLEESLGPALASVLEGQLLPAIDRAAAESLPPLVRDSTREAMLGLGEALEGELGEQARAFVFSLVDESKGRVLGDVRGASSWLWALAVALVAVSIACAVFWRQARERRRRCRSRESALFLVTGAINRLPDELRSRVKSAVAEAGRKDGGDRTGGTELQLFLDRYNL